MVDKRGKNGFEVKRKEKYRMRGLNPRPIACEAIVITTTPTRPVVCFHFCLHILCTLLHSVGC